MYGTGVVPMTATAVLCALTAAPAAGYNNGMGQKPPMGWSSWCTDSLCNAFGHDLCTEELVKTTTDAIVEQGMAKLGYNYVTLDDCWSTTERDANGSLVADPKKFPNGMKAVADYVHSKGLRFGVYTCVGTKTCKGDRPGTFGHWQQDADTLTSWGVDFVKMDHCTANHSIPDVELYGNMSQALNHTGRPVLFSLCNWGLEDVWTWGADIAQMYRIQMDHLPLWSVPGNQSAGVGFGQGTKEIIEFVASLVPSRWIKQYGYLDPDFLMTLYPITMPFVESRTEYSFWALWSAPMLVSTDIRKLSSEKKQILMNPEVIAINQDDLITAGDRVRGTADTGQVWSRSMSNGDKAVLLYNPGTASISINVTWTELNITAVSCHVRDLWQQTNLGNFTSGYEAVDLGKHDVKFLRVGCH